MKKLDAIKYIFGSIFILSILNGCLKYEQITVLHTDGSGEMFAHVWTDFKSGSDSAFFNYFNSDSIKNLFDTNYANLDDIEVYKDFRDSTLHAKVELNFQSIESLNELKVFKGINFHFAAINSKHFEFSQNTLSHFVPLNSDSNSVSIQYIYYIPGEVIEHNADDLSNNKLTWTFNPSSEQSKPKLYAKFIPFKLKETPLWIYYTVLFVLIVVIVFLIKKRDT